MEIYANISNGIQQTQKMESKKQIEWLKFDVK